MRTLFTICGICIFLSTAIAQTPSNDLCANAIRLELSTDCLYNIPQFNTGATAADPDVNFDPICTTDFGQNDVWYYFEVPPSGRAHIDFLQRGFLPFAEAYSGNCSNLEIILDNNGNCNYFDDFLYQTTINLDRTPGEIIYIRVFGDQTSTEGEFRICAVEYEAPLSTNTCSNPINLNISNSCNLRYFENYPWYSIDIPYNVPFVNIDVHAASYSGPEGLKISVYKNSCSNLELIARGRSVKIDNNNRPNQTYLVRVDDEYGFPGVYGVCAFYKENDFCEGATQINVGSNCVPNPVSSFGSTPSRNPKLSPNCGYDERFYDAWVQAIVPPSGNISFEVTLADIQPAFTYERAVEYYTGTCNNLEVVFCDDRGFTSNSTVHKVQLIGQIPGSKIYVRLFLGRVPEGFTICAYEESMYPDLCRVDAVVFSEIGQCDPNTGLFHQPFDVYYTTPPGSDNYLRMNGMNFTLSGNSPDSFVIPINPDGGEYNHQNTKILGDCSSPTAFNYLHFSIFDEPESCPLPQTNDNCHFAIEIDPITECSVETEFPATDPITTYPHLPKLSEGYDNWFKFVVTNDLLISDLFFEFSVNSSARPFLELFRGSCNNLEIIPSQTGGIASDDVPYELRDLVLGETIYIRVVHPFTSSSRTLSFCAEPVILCNDVEFISIPLNVDTFYQVNNLITSNSVLGNNSHVLFQANNRIELLGGFDVPKYHTFHAIIDACE